MKLTLMVVATAIWIAPTMMTTVEAQATGQQGSVTTSAQDKPTLLQSEAEIWEFLEKLCEEMPTQRCETMDFLRVRDGEVLPMPSYNEADAYQSLHELMEAVRAAQAGQTPGEGG